MRVLLSLLVLLFVVEGMAKLAIWAGLGINVWSYRQYYSRDPKLAVFTWMDSYEAHPYFGYVSGRFRDRTAILNTRSEDDYVIAILGGAAAESVARFLTKNPSSLSRLRHAIPQIGDKRIQVANLALGGYKQPQQFFAASFFLERIDLVVNLDGFKEVVAYGFSPLYPMEFPELSLKLYDHGRAGAGWRFVGNTLKWSYAKMARLPRAIPELSFSHSYFLFWHLFHGPLAQAIDAVDGRFLAAVLGKDAGAYSLDHKLAIWKRYTLLQSRLVTMSGKPSIFFVQPNQYLKGSKPLSPEEKAAAFDPAIESTFGRGMQRLRDAVPELRANGVRIFDLTGIFADVKETLYIDDCCHLNERGHELLAEAMIDILAQHVAVRAER